MISDILDIIFLYIDIDQYYKLSQIYDLDILYYCRNVNPPTGIEPSYIHFLKIYDIYHEIITDSTFSKLDWAYYYNYIDVIHYLKQKKHVDTRDSNLWKQLDNS